MWPRICSSPLTEPSPKLLASVQVPAAVQAHAEVLITAASGQNGTQSLPACMAENAENGEGTEPGSIPQDSSVSLSPTAADCRQR